MVSLLHKLPLCDDIVLDISQRVHEMHMDDVLPSLKLSRVELSVLEDEDTREQHFWSQDEKTRCIAFVDDRETDILLYIDSWSLNLEIVILVEYLADNLDNIDNLDNLDNLRKFRVKRMWEKNIGDIWSYVPRDIFSTSTARKWSHRESLEIRYYVDVPPPLVRID